jgi:hypothetical protein
MKRKRLKNLLATDMRRNDMTGSLSPEETEEERNHRFCLKLMLYYLIDSASDEQISDALERTRSADRYGTFS